MTPEAAVDEILAVFKAAWDAAGYAAAWSDVPNALPPANAESPWARVVVRHDEGGQTSLGNGSGGKLHSASGTLWAQVFVPIGQGQARGLQLCHIVLQAYRDARGAVWYRHHRFREAGNSGAFELFNCLVDFTYDI